MQVDRHVALTWVGHPMAPLRVIQKNEFTLNSPIALDLAWAFGASSPLTVLFGNRVETARPFIANSHRGHCQCKPSSGGHSTAKTSARDIRRLRAKLLLA